MPTPSRRKPKRDTVTLDLIKVAAVAGLFIMTALLVLIAAGTNAHPAFSGVLAILQLIVAGNYAWDIYSLWMKPKPVKAAKATRIGLPAAATTTSATTAVSIAPVDSHPAA